jgi:amino acid transporter
MSINADDADSELLARLGYQQQLKRRIGAFTNFAISFSIISVLAGPITSYYIGFANGGPVMMAWGWPLVSTMCVVVALGIAELASAMPTAGGLYFWACRMATPRWGWFTGWFNIVGLVGAVAAVGYGFSLTFTSLLVLLWPGTFSATTGTLYAVYAIAIIAMGVVNYFDIRIVALTNNISAWWHFIGTAVIVVALVVVPDHHQSASYVFTKTINASGFGGHHWSQPMFWFVLGLGLLQAQYTIGGFDASAHMSEETTNASRAAARGVWTSVFWSGVGGWILLLAITFAIPNTQSTLDAGAFDVQYIWSTALGSRWAEALLFIASVAQFLCCNAVVTASSRVVWALSRDRATPASHLWTRLNRFRVPFNAVAVIVAINLLLMLPTFWNATIGYLIATAVVVIGLYLAYAFVIFLRLRLGDQFETGPWNLGRWYKVIDIVSIVWIALVCLLFISPTSPAGIPFNHDFSWESFNYTLLTVAGAFVLFGGWWVLSARHWFRGPVPDIQPEALAAAESAHPEGMAT